MSLIARHFEANGLPTLILGSALDILSAGQPPRAKFLNYPLGFESGRFRDSTDQLAVVQEALKGFDDMHKPGIETLPFEWQDGWDMVNERERVGPTIAVLEQPTRNFKPKKTASRPRKLDNSLEYFILVLSSHQPRCLAQV